jgi:hypothetical protein
MSDSNLQDEVKSGDMRRALIAIRDYLVQELDVNRCSSCMASKLKTGDTAALVLRLQKVLEEIASLADPNSVEEDPVKRAQEKYAAASGGASVTDITSNLGTKRAPRLQGGKRFRTKLD